jgi:hypothetical protein
MVAIYSTVTCAEEHATQSEDWGVDRWDASVVLRCAWANRYLLVNDILGNQRQWPYSGYGAVPRAASASVVPDETQYVQDGQGMQYIDALVTVGYSSDVEEDLVAETIEPNAEFVTLDHKKFRWGAANGDPLLAAEAPGKLTRSLSITRQLFKLTSIPTTVLSSVGGVNNAVYNSALLGLSFPTETLLYTPPNMGRTITTAGSKGWNLTMKFMYKPDTWNKFWRAKTQAYTRIYNLSGGIYYNHPLKDFSSLLF